MVWRIEFDRAALRSFERLDPQAQKRLSRFLRDRVAPAADPRAFGQALAGPTFGEFWKYRVGDYRLVCKIRDDVVSILVIRVGHRRDVYR